jgi:hypothetical protein
VTFRAIDIGGFTPATLRDQVAPTLVWAPLAEMVIDARYQRALTPAGRRAIQRIADTWDWAKFQPVLVAATPDGLLAVVDGQHRVHAACVAGLAALPAMVVPMTPAQQAAAFVSVNTERIRLSGTDVFKARLAGGDALACAAAALVAEAGCRLMTYQPSAAQRRPGDVFTHALILRMVAQGEGAAVLAGLRAVRESVVGSGRGLSADAGLRVYDSLVLHPWLGALASNQRFLRLPLAAIFDTIDWDAERDAARSWMRNPGDTLRALMADRVRVILREALDRQAAA